MKGCLKNKVPIKTFLLSLVCFLLFTILSSPGFAATQTVVNCLNSGAGSLRQALSVAATGDVIAFNIDSSIPASTGEVYGGKVTAGSDVWYRIVINSELPINRGNIIVQGSSQTINKGDSNTKGPEIEVRINKGSTSNVFYVAKDYVTIEGLTINRYTSEAYIAGAGIELGSAADYSHIYGCYIGAISATGESSPIIDPHATGIEINGSGYHLIGGTSSTESNIIAANSSDGIYLTNSSDNRIVGNVIYANKTGGISLSDASNNRIWKNKIGFTSNGTTVRANRFSGIRVGNTSQNNIIGSSESGGGNLIVASSESAAGFYGFGINFIGSNVTNNYVYNNIIGLTSSEAIPTQRGYAGIAVQNNASNNQIGGRLANQRNIISGHSYYGVYFDNASNNKIFGNYIGFKSDGETVRANKNFGVYIAGSSQNNYIGTSESGGRNLIIASSETNSAGIYISDGTASNNHIYNNIIGLTSTEAEPASRESIGVWITENAHNNYIGGVSTGEGNTISKNKDYGIHISSGANNNEILGNRIGTDSTGTIKAGNTTYGVHITGGAWYNRIGNGTIGGRNVISDNGWGVAINSSNTNSNEVLGNYIGTDVNGTADLGNSSHGVYIDSGAQYNLIGDGTDGGRNIISGNDAYGIIITGSSNSNEVKGNYVGTDKDGTTSLANTFYGVLINTSSYNKIGGLISGEGNLLSGNNSAGIGILTNSRYNLVIGNLIGTDRSGGISLHNNNNGINMDGSAFNRIGDGTADGKNVISGNNQSGIRINNCSSNEVCGNFIGTTASGEAPLANSVSGIYLEGGSYGNKIGKVSDAQKNILSGNSLSGVLIDGSNSNEVKANYIGTNKNGNAALANGQYGIQIGNGAMYNVIGGDASSEGNLISGNNQYGVYILQSNTNSNEIKNNTIGLDWNRTGKIPNSYGICLDTVGAHQIRGNIISGNTNNGILIQGDTFGTVTISQNIIGTNYPDFASGLGNGRQGIYNTDRSNVMIGGGNTIAYNGNPSYSEGIRLESSNVTGNVITQNSIFFNYGKGIALINGANPTTSTPEVITADHSDATGLTLITGESAPANGTVEVFKAEGNQGKTYLGSTIASGTGSWLINVPGLVSGDAVTATGTTQNPETSEFSLTKEAITTVFKEFQPDNLIATLESYSDITGEAIYNTDGTDQTRTRSIANGASAAYYIKIENDANTTDEVIVKGRGSSGDWALTYYDAKTGGNNITSSIEGSGWSTGILASGGTREVRMVVANSGSTISTLEALVTSESKTQSTMKDAVKAVATAVTTTTTTTTISAVTTTTTSTTTTTVPAKYYSATDLNVPGLTIDIPAGALTADATVTATVVTAPADPPAGFMIGGTIVNIQPTGLVFTAPVTITLSINGPLADPRIYYWNGTAWSRDGITVISYTDTLLTFTTTHFTIFAPMAAIPSNLVRFGPNPFNPNSGSGRFWYWLSADRGTTIYLTDLGGTVVWKMTYPAGGNGGKANENNVAYDGKTAWGDALGNGVYIYKIVQDGKIIGGGKIAVIK